MIMTPRKDFLFCLQPIPRKGVHARWGGQPFAGAFSKDEIQSLEELDSERLSANWHDSSS